MGALGTEVKTRQGGVGLSGLMLAVIYFAVFFWVSKGVLEAVAAISTGTPGPAADRMLDGVIGMFTMLGLTAIVFGWWLAERTEGPLSRLLAWVFMVGGCCMMAFALLSFGGVVAAPAMIFGLVVARFRLRSAHRESLLWTMAIAARNDMPLGPGVAAFADQVGGRFRQRVRTLARQLDEGVPLPVAIENVPGTLNEEAELFTRVGYEARCLPGALHDAATGIAARQEVRGPILRKVGYLAFVTLQIQLISGFIIYFIAPKYEAIFKDFNVPLPPITTWTFVASRGIGAMGLAALGTFFLEAILLIYLPLAYLDIVRFRLPGLGPMFAGPHRRTVLRCLAMGVEAGRPVGDSVRSLSRWFPRAWMRRRLSRAYQEIDAGEDWIVTMRRFGLIGDADAKALEAATRAGNLAWMLRTLADAGERRALYRIESWMQFLFPLAVLFVGGVVFALGVAYFSPIVTLIQALTEPVEQ